MDILKKLWPFSFVQKKDVTALVVNIIIHVIGFILIGVICWLIGFIPVIGGIAAWAIGSIVELYLLAGLIFSILNYCKIL